MRDQDERYAIVQTFVNAIYAPVCDENICMLQDFKLRYECTHNKVRWDCAKLGDIRISTDRQNELCRIIRECIEAGVVKRSVCVVNRA